MTNKEVMQMALNALEILNGAETVEGVFVYTDQELDALRACLAQPEPEPVQWQKRHTIKTVSIWENTNEHDAKWWRDNSRDWEIRALYTAPPQRKEWVGLPNDEYETMAEGHVTNCYFDTLMYAKAIEAKLKEKNTWHHTNAKR